METNDKDFILVSFCNTQINHNVYDKDVTCSYFKRNRINESS